MASEEMDAPGCTPQTKMLLVWVPRKKNLTEVFLVIW